MNNANKRKNPAGYEKHNVLRYRPKLPLDRVQTYI